MSQLSKRIVKLLRKEGYLSDLSPDEAPSSPLLEEEATYVSLMSASVMQKISLGERQGQRVRFIGSGFGYEEEAPGLKGDLCAMVNGFSLHANVSIPR